MYLVITFDMITIKKSQSFFLLVVIRISEHGTNSSTSRFDFWNTSEPGLFISAKYNGFLCHNVD